MNIENFSLLEAIELAINMEEEGVRFYGLAIDKARDEEMKDLFSLLREKEYEHINTFRSFHSDMTSSQEYGDADLYLLDPEVSSYLNAYIESTVFPVKGAAEEALSGIRETKDILKLGMQVEKDSIHYYQELSSHSPYPDAAVVLNKIIEEEKKHLGMLHKMWKEVSGK